MHKRTQKTDNIYLFIYLLHKTSAEKTDHKGNSDSRSCCIWCTV